MADREVAPLLEMAMDAGRSRSQSSAYVHWARDRRRVVEREPHEQDCERLQSDVGGAAEPASAPKFEWAAAQVGLVLADVTRMPGVLAVRL